MTDQKTKAARFKALHVAGSPLVLVNVWDAGSARIVAAADAPALATGSWSVASAHGASDGENLDLDLAIANLARIVATVDLPVSIDIESGYDDPAGTVERTIDAGAIGCNMEDSFPRDGTLRDIAEQAARIKDARRVADRAGIPYFINARTDVFFQKDERDFAARMGSAIGRAQAYADAGADGLFVPGLADLEQIAQLVAASPLPVNIMLGADSPAPGAFAGTGVARLSYGPTPYRRAMQALEEMVVDVLKGQSPD